MKRYKRYGMMTWMGVGTLRENGYTVFDHRSPLNPVPLFSPTSNFGSYYFYADPKPDQKSVRALKNF